MNNRRRFCWLALLFMALFLAVPAGRKLLIPERVWAAGTGESPERLDFTDKSGKYLLRRGNDWYIYDKKGKALTGVQYLKIKRIKGLLTGVYMFDSKGKLVQKESVYYLRKVRAGTQTFNGYYGTDGKGRFLTEARGWRYLKPVKCNGITFSGFFYMDAYGKLSNPEQVRYMPAQTVSGVKFPAGYYYFNKYGRLSTSRVFRTLKQKAGNMNFNGTYYFGGIYGSLYTKAGWIYLGTKWYYLTAAGQRCFNCWVDGYYLQPDGTIAICKQLPDGTCVDVDGHKCEREYMVLSPLRKQLEKMISGYRGSWSVYVKNLKTGDVVNINERSMYPASVIKAFVMASTFDQISRGKLSYSTSIKSLLREMITVSDNEAYNQLVRCNSPSRGFVSGAAQVNQYIRANGYVNTGCHSTLHPASSPSQSDGHSNTSSARDCGLLLEKIYNGTCVSPVFSREMLNLLLAQTRTWKIPSGVPSGIRVANKTGETSTVQHDMAIVYGKNTTYVICVFSSGVSEYSGINGIRSISRQVYNYLN